MKVFKFVILVIISPLRLLIAILSQRYYLVSGTFINMQGERMFCRTIFRTSFFQFPLQKIEKEMGENLGSKSGSVLITGIQKIPKWMAKSSETGSRSEYDFDIKIFNT